MNCAVSDQLLYLFWHAPSYRALRNST